jgi:CheY-like chemotaxis protein
MSNQSRTILIVEDDESLSYAISRYVKAAGYRTAVVGSSMQALKFLAQNKVDLILTDVKLKEGEPYGTSLARVVNYSDTIPVILITGYPGLIEDQTDLPGPVLHKPIDFPALEREIKSSLAKQEPVAGN